MSVMISSTVAVSLVFTVIILVISALGFKFVVDIYKYNKSSKGWLSILITMAVLPMWAAFRVYELYSYPIISSLGAVNIFVDYIIFPFLALIPLVIGILYMRKSFEGFELARKMTSEKVANLNKRSTNKK